MTGNLDQFSGISVFVTVVEVGSLTAAAQRLGNSTSFVSKELKRLEDRLGARLLNRTTRRLSLTDVGRHYFERCRQIVSDAEDAERVVGYLHETPRGVLRISAPVSFEVSYLRSELPRFLTANPEIRLEIDVNDRMVDVVAEGFDVVIRIGDLRDSNLISRRIMTSRAVTLASPDYLARNGRPVHPSDLSRHACISYAYQQTPGHWEYAAPDGRIVGVNVTPAVLCNSAELEAAMAIAGIGVTRLPAFVCEREIADGRLEVILEDYEREPLGVYAVYPHRQHLSAKVRAFVDFVVERFGHA